MVAFKIKVCPKCGMAYAPKLENDECPHALRYINVSASKTTEKEYKDYLEGKRPCL